jgi:hypothetical protein
MPDRAAFLYRPPTDRLPEGGVILYEDGTIVSSDDLREKGLWPRRTDR